MMLTNILLIIILIFVIGNLIIGYLLKRRYLRYLPLNEDARKDSKFDVIESKLDLLNKRVVKLEVELKHKKKK